MEQNKRREQSTAPEADKKEAARKLLAQYTAQNAGDEEVHFEHYDWTYNDSSCCC